MAQARRGENLRDLVTRMLDERDISGRQFAKLAADRGYTVSYTTINSVKNGTRVRVTDETLAAIAEVFGVPESQVRAAAGAPPRDDSTDPQLLAAHKELSPEGKEAGLRMYREFVRTLKAARNQQGHHPH